MRFFILPALYDWKSWQLMSMSPLSLISIYWLVCHFLLFAKCVCTSSSCYMRHQAIDCRISERVHVHFKVRLGQVEAYISGCILSCRNVFKQWWTRPGKLSLPFTISQCYGMHLPLQAVLGTLPTAQSRSFQQRQCGPRSHTETSIFGPDTAQYSAYLSHVKGTKLPTDCR